MGTPHINANPGDFAKVVLMPGDPLRAKMIADHYLVDAKIVTSVRNMFGYTGYTRNGKRVSVMASGMGIPSIGIYSHELYDYFGVESIIRVGTCGSYQEDIDLKDVLICTTASSDSNWANQYLLGATISAGADFELAKAAYEECQKQGLKFHVGNIFSADVFYDYDKNMWKRYKALNMMGVEMESYGLYLTAQQMKKRALCILTVSDHFVKPDKLTVEERQTGLGAMIRIAIAVAEKFAD